MPWREGSVMDQRREFVMLAKQEGVNRRRLCRQFGISAETGCKWIERYDAGDTTLADRSRRPQRSPDARPQRSGIGLSRCAMPTRPGEPAKSGIA